MEAYVIFLFILAGIGVYWYGKSAAKKALALKCPNCGATVERGQPLCPHCGRDMTVK